MASSNVGLPGPGAEFEDPGRIRLIQEFEDSLKESLEDPKIPCTAWAFLWLCDVDMLEEHLR